MNDAPTFQPRDRSALAKWLDENQDKMTAVWIILYKKSTGKQTVGFNDVLEEAAAHGWVDSREKSTDDERYALYITPRRTDSNWNQSNRELAKRLLAEGKVSEFGKIRLPTDL